MSGITGGTYIKIRKGGSRNHPATRHVAGRASLTIETFARNFRPAQVGDQVGGLKASDTDRAGRLMEANSSPKAR